MRSQRDKRGMSEELRAAAQRDKRLFVHKRP
jgi:hypothetical protein